MIPAAWHSNLNVIEPFDSRLNTQIDIQGTLDLHDLIRGRGVISIDAILQREDILAFIAFDTHCQA
jgi:hypothetical protein